jgi:hypothetical protein
MLARHAIIMILLLVAFGFGMFHSWATSHQVLADTMATSTPPNDSTDNSASNSGVPTRRDLVTRTPPPSASSDLESSGAVRTSGVERVLVELTEPSVSEVFATANAQSLSPVQVAMEVVRQLGRVRSSQADLIVVLSSPDIGATIVSQSWVAQNALIIDVAADKLDQIRALSSVRAVYRGTIVERHQQSGSSE